jgi:hypothetical protein
MMDAFLIACIAVLFSACVWFYIAGSARSRQSVPFVLAPGTSVSSAPLLSEADVVLYNLMRLAVQDHYLIFAQVPLWSFVSVEAMGKSRSQLLQHIALKRVDFVLIHPGSRHVEKVVQFEEVSTRPHQADRQRVIESVLDAAGIKLVTLRPHKPYTVPDLAALLGLEPEE